jgi:hypothetical protein
MMKALVITKKVIEILLYYVAVILFGFLCDLFMSFGSLFSPTYKWEICIGYWAIGVGLLVIIAGLLASHFVRRRSSH